MPSWHSIFAFSMIQSTFCKVEFGSLSIFSPSSIALRINSRLFINFHLLFYYKSSLFQSDPSFGYSILSLLYSFCFSLTTSNHSGSKMSVKGFKRRVKNLIIFIISTLITKFTSWVHTTVAFGNYPSFIHNITSKVNVGIYSSLPNLQKVISPNTIACGHLPQQSLFLLSTETLRQNSQ